VTFNIIVTPSGLITEVNQFPSAVHSATQLLRVGAWLAMLYQALMARNSGNCVAAAPFTQAS
jgi:hypothetical protein